jgi:sensor histidine kinase YesM
MNKAGHIKVKVIAMHCVAWMVILLLPYLLSPAYGANKDPDAASFAILNTLTAVFWIITFYLTVFVFVEKFIYPKKYLVFSLLMFALFTVIMCGHYLLYHSLIHSHPFDLVACFEYRLPAFLLTAASGVAYKMIIDRNHQETVSHEKKEQNLKTELSFLRSQISPHFIFNILHSMLAMARSKNDLLEPTILKLSGLMQYMLYETDEEKVSLKDEVEYLQNYIDLQKQRFGSNVNINVQMNGDSEGHEIEPMLLIPFVENAFKHGVGMIEEPFIEIALRLEKNILHFKVVNKFNSLHNEIKDKTSGIGLANVTRRLNLLYHRKHNLSINNNGNLFYASLQIILT